MATGFTDRFRGKIKAYVIYLGGGGIVDAASGIAGGIVSTQKISLPVTATANTDIPAISLPAGKTLLRASVLTTTAYGAATDCKIEIGTSAGDNTYVAQVSIKAIGVVALTLATAAGLAVLGAAPQLYVRLVQTGAASATGAATLVLEYA
jgi:hypothetical protein